ncbi:glycine oxidase ThiO [Nocardioides panaciterrulae]|uniref:glycine oxidase n=1 Tax=Nocardioides panaciterrulae TaxID=661492 RepID=A0A7Y9JBK6_9ACTN|nr:glycine oxidase ThiO [Nocardioides panaciterrulae]NYD42473.1 glycine oxidase [Nocardioides panaciterrulae]
MTGSVVIAGGGLIGVGIAWRCAQRGLRVTVVDPRPGAGASYAAAGMLAPVTEAAYGEERLLQLCRASLDRFPRFVEEVQQASGLQVGLRTVGTLVVGFDADDMAALQEQHEFQRQLGLEVERLTPREARRREPALSPRIRGALAVDGDHSVDGRSLHAALLSAAEAAGVRVVRRRATSLVVHEGRASGLVLDDGSTESAESVVVALGASSDRLPGVPRLGVRPVKGQILRLAGAGGLLRGTVRALVHGRQVYLVPYGQDRLIVGATVEERGFETTVTAGGVHDLLRDAVAVVAGVTELEWVEAIARWRPGTPDNAPVIGPTSVPGLVVATGHYRNGVLLTPVTGDVVAELLATGVLPDVASPFAVPDLTGSRP